MPVSERSTPRGLSEHDVSCRNSLLSPTILHRQHSPAGVRPIFGGSVLLAADWAWSAVATKWLSVGSVCGCATGCDTVQTVHDLLCVFALSRPLHMLKIFLRVHRDWVHPIQRRSETILQLASENQGLRDVQAVSVAEVCVRQLSSLLSPRPPLLIKIIGIGCCLRVCVDV